MSPWLRFLSIPCPVLTQSRPSPRVTIYISVPSVPPEAVNMSLGLSLAFTPKPFQLLVSCVGSWECPKGRSWRPKTAGAGVLLGGGAGVKGQEAGRAPPTCPLRPRPVAPLGTVSARTTPMRSASASCLNPTYCSNPGGSQRPSEVSTDK